MKKISLPLIAASALAIGADINALQKKGATIETTQTTTSPEFYMATYKAEPYKTIKRRPSYTQKPAS